jgi:hypothetical protein
LDIGDVVALADGTRVLVIGEEADLGRDAEAQTVFVGTMAEAPATA